MDNRITKSRLSDLLSYEWILMLIIAIASIIVWELGYAMGAVKLTVGQEFKYYYDSTIVVEDNRELQTRIINQDTFSFDVMKLSTEALSEENYMLGDRLSIQEGDVIFTDILGIDEKTQKPKVVRAKSMIDSYYKYFVGSLDQMIYDAKIYLTKNFFDGVYESQIKDIVEVAEEQKGQLPMLKALLKSGNTDSEKILNSIDDKKVEKMFLKRNKEDNRFRKKSAIEQGIKLEKERIIKLCENVLFFEDFVINNKDALFEYSRYEQASRYSPKSKEAVAYENLKKRNLRRFGKEEEIFGIKLGQLKNGGEVSKVMRLSNPKDNTKVADGIVLMTFDFIKYQPDLQFESLSFVCSTIKMFSGE